MTSIKECLRSVKEYSTTCQNSRLLCDFEKYPEKEVQLKKIFVERFCKAKIEGFKVDQQNIETLRAIFAYFHGNTGTFDVKKGIYLYGEFGSGKTSLFGLISNYLANVFPFSANGFGNASLEQVANEFKNGTDERGNKKNSIEGYVFSKYTGKPYEICFHEVGKTVNEKFYGTDIDGIINSMFMRRYEVFQAQGTRTHCTSNFHPKNLVNFDNAVLDRFSEMFNFVKWNGASFRK